MAIIAGDTYAERAIAGTLNGRRDTSTDSHAVLGVESDPKSIPLTAKGAAAGVASLGTDLLLIPAQRPQTYGTLAARPSAATAGDKAIYFATDDNGGTLYQVQSAAWLRIAPKGVELWYAETTTNQTGIGTSATDVTGLTLPSLVVGDRPVKLTACIPSLSQVTASGQPVIFITQSDNTAIGRAVVPTLAAGASGGGVIIEARVPAGTGAYPVKVRAQTSGASATLTINAATSFRPNIWAVEQ